ncbi:hypothetical protein T492DRAFT_1005310, partial [Pavlovales sp. CCMP2436]
MHGEMPSKKRFIELYKTNPKCAITGYAFDPANDSEQQLPTPVRIDQSTGYEDGNLAFVVRFVGNSMRNGHSTFAHSLECHSCITSGTRHHVLVTSCSSASRSPSINAVYTNTPENNYPLAPETWLNSEAMGILHGVFGSGLGYHGERDLYKVTKNGQTQVMVHTPSN